MCIMCVVYVCLCAFFFLFVRFICAALVRRLDQIICINANLLKISMPLLRPPPPLKMFNLVKLFNVIYRHDSVLHWNWIDRFFTVVACYYCVLLIETFSRMSYSSTRHAPLLLLLYSFYRYAIFHLLKSFYDPYRHELKRLQFQPFKCFPNRPHIFLTVAVCVQMLTYTYI